MTGAELRASILQAAVQGRLATQDPTDEPASVLLERIREERRALVKAKKAKAPKGGESVITRYPDGTVWEQRGNGATVEITDEIPFDIPEGWEWARLGCVFDMQAGKNISAASISPVEDGSHPYRCYGGNGLRGYVAEPNRSGDYPLIGRQGALCGNIKRATGEFYATEHAVVVSLFGGMDVAWACRFLDALNLNQYATATAQPGLSVAKIGETFIPVPPLAEQRRIVAKLDELMLLVERYDRLDRERTELNAGIEGAMRASVLQAAVQGRLTEREPDDESASELLERIREERLALVKAKKAKVQKGGESRIWRANDGTVWEQRGKGKAADITDEVPFDIPEGWEWARLDGLAWFGGGHTPSTADKSNFEENGILWVTSKDMKRDYIDSTQITLSETGAAKLERYQPGTILMVTRSGILRRLLPVAMLVEEATVNQDQKAIVPFDNEMSRWLLAYFKASDYRIRTEFGKAGTTVESVVFDRVKTMLVPVPPLADQRRIVAKLDEMLPKVERLGELASKNGTLAALVDEHFGR